jgi:hypothetical protein
MNFYQACVAKVLAIRGLNKNHKYDLKNIFKGAANRAAAVTAAVLDAAGKLVMEAILE